MPESVVMATTSGNSVSTMLTAVLALTTTNDPYTGPFKSDFFKYIFVRPTRYALAIFGTATNSLISITAVVSTTGGGGGVATTGGGASVFAVSVLR